MWPEQMSSRINLGDTSPTMVEVFADFAQPLADEAAEYREALERLYNSIDSCMDLTPELMLRTRAILDKYKKP